MITRKFASLQSRVFTSITCPTSPFQQPSHLGFPNLERMNYRLPTTVFRRVNFSELEHMSGRFREVPLVKFEGKVIHALRLKFPKNLTPSLWIWLASMQAHSSVELHLDTGGLAQLIFLGYSYSYGIWFNVEIKIAPKSELADITFALSWNKRTNVSFGIP